MKKYLYFLNDISFPIDHSVVYSTNFIQLFPIIENQMKSFLHTRKLLCSHSTSPRGPVLLTHSDDHRLAILSSQDTMGGDRPISLLLHYIGFASILNHYRIKFLCEENLLKTFKNQTDLEH